jgi:tetratricopeptide (TPR) repeat protein
MFSKPFFRAFAAAALLAACGAVAFAQVTTVSGKVTLKQADGTVAPLPNANVILYRTDIKGKYELKTDKKGVYTHAGIPFVGTYTVVVCGPGARATWLTGLRFANTPPPPIELTPGDGSCPSLDEIAKLGGTAGGGAPATPGAAAPAGESKEAKAAREERERKIKEVEEQNRKITEGNEVVSRTFKAGNEALNAGRAEEAIKHYSEGIAARPDEPGLLTNYSVALRRRGVDRYNAAIKSTDNDAKAQGIEAAKKDWRDSADSARKALDIIKANSATADAQQQATYTQSRYFALVSLAESMKFVATKVDQTQAQAAWTAYQEYMAAETDAAKKAKAMSDALQTIFDAGAVELAQAEARKVLAADPDHVDANRILGLALFASGEKANYQEAANFLQRYVDKAPDTDPLKASARESLEYLRTAENVRPDRSQPSRPAGRRRP